MTSDRRWWALSLLLAVGWLLQLVMAPAASAHATVASSDPADGARLVRAPSAVTITFDEPVGLDLGYLKVVDASGTDVTSGQATHPGGQGQVIGVSLKSGLGDGTYIESWRVISADSHPVQGSIRFVVGTGALSTVVVATTPVVATSTSIAFDAVRTAGYISLVMLGGAWLLMSSWAAGLTNVAARRVLIVGWTLGVVAAIAELLLQGVYAAGAGLGGLLRFDLLSDTVASNYGRMIVLRLLLLAGLAAFLDSTMSAAGTRPTVRRSVPGILLFLGVVFTFSYSGHAEVAHPVWLAVTSDMSHLTAMSVWIGGLVMLVVGLLPSRNAQHLRAALPVFSRTAFCCVVVILATGTYQAWRESGTVRAITTTTYGRLILVKVALLIGLVILGNLSRLAIQRAYLRRTVAVPAGGPTDDTVPAAAGMPAGVDTRRMRRSVMLELVLAAAVLSVTGVLVAQPPGRAAVVTPAAPASSASTALGSDRSVTVTVDPAQHGIVSVDLKLDGGPAAENVTLTATLPANQLGPLPVSLTRSGTFSYHADGQLLPAPGRWTFNIAVQTGEFDSTTASVQIQIS